MAKKVAEVRSPFTKGRVSADLFSSRAGLFLSIKENEFKVFAPAVGLEDMLSGQMHEYWDIRPAIYHPCIGPAKCPSCKNGHAPRFKAYLPVLTREGEVKVFPFGAKVAEQLQDLDDEIEGGLKGQVIRVSRKGGGLKTRYAVSGVGKIIDVSGVEIPDFVPTLGPSTVDGIEALLAGAGVSDAASAGSSEAAADGASEEGKFVSTGWGDGDDEEPF